MTTGRGRPPIALTALSPSLELSSEMGGYADSRAHFVTLAKENRAAEMGRFGRPFRPT